MRFLSCLAVVLGACQSAVAQDGGLASAISNNTQLSGFRKFLEGNSGAFNSILPSDMGGVTILVPTNGALDNYYNKTGERFESLPWDKLTAILRYHTFAARVTNSNFTSAATGLTVPTLLRDEAYNNRTAGAGLISQFGAAAAQGNVVFLSKDRLNPVRLRLRQTSGGGISARGGLASDASITAVDGRWALGYYQIIDSVLEPPAKCSETIRTLKSNLEALDKALNRSALWSTLDSSSNVTCLGPSNDAFKAAGNPQQDGGLSVADVQSVVLFHTLPEVTYTNFLQDGDVFKSVQGGNVKVAIVNGEIYFNDAKITSPNVLTNNGVIHVLDRIMSPNGTAPAPTTSTTTPTATASPSPSKSPNAGPRVAAAGSTGAALFAFAAAAALL